MNNIRNRQSVIWFNAASEYTGFNRRLADILKQHIPEGCSMCDMGCGAALADIELAQYCRSITAVDISEEVISAVRENIEKLGITNITAKAADGRCLKEVWDVVLVMFYGDTEEFDIYLKKAGKALIFVTYIDKYGSFGTKESRKQKHLTADKLKKHLEINGISYECTEHCLEYGQPFKSFSDASEFLRAYTFMEDQSEIDAYLNEALEATGREDYPYYLPNLKKFAIFTVNKEADA